MPNEISFKLICHDLSKIRVENYFTDFTKTWLISWKIEENWGKWGKQQVDVCRRQVCSLLECKCEKCATSSFYFERYSEDDLEIFLRLANCSPFANWQQTHTWGLNESEEYLSLSLALCLRAQRYENGKLGLFKYSFGVCFLFVFF